MFNANKGELWASIDVVVFESYKKGIFQPLLLWPLAEPPLFQWFNDYILLHIEPPYPALCKHFSKYCFRFCLFFFTQVIEFYCHIIFNWMLNIWHFLGCIIYSGQNGTNLSWCKKIYIAIKRLMMIENLKYWILPI